MSEPVLRLAVCGLHLKGQPLHSQLTDLHAVFIRTCLSAEKYRLYAVGPPITAPTKPGMIKMTSGSCLKVPMELYDVPLQNVGAFISKVPPPLAIGTVELESGELCKGFVCEGYVAYGGDGIEDITHLGSWKGFLDRPKGSLTARHETVE